jgi:hypothetical protein
MARIFFAGDIVNTSREDGIFCSAGMQEELSRADYVIGNLEAPLLKGEKRAKTGPSLYQNPSTLKGLKEQGFDCVTLANNHIMDYGDEGLRETISTLRGNGIAYLGAGLSEHDAYAPLVVQVDGMKIALLNACEAQFGVLNYFSESDVAGYAWINHYRIDQTIRRLKQENDCVIVLAHAGLEHYPVPQMEWRCRYRQLCDCGADLVIAAHPHVPQGYEKWGDAYIFYSLGNFYFDALGHANSRDDSYSVLVELGRSGVTGFDLIYHCKIDGLVQKMAPNEVAFKIDDLNQLLGDGYRAEWEKMSLTQHRKIHSLMRYCISPILSRGNVIESVRRMASRLLGRSGPLDRDLMLYHLLNNESYYYAQRHALSMKSKKR